MEAKLATDETRNQAFEIIQNLAISGKKMTRSDKMKSLLDNINALAKYQSDVINHLDKQKKQG